MASQRIAFRTDANSEIGTGHFMRCLTLANELKKHGAEIGFVSRGMPAYLVQMLQEQNIDLYELPNVDTEDADDLPHSKWLKTSQLQDALQTIELLGKSKLDWLVVDHYAIDQRWERPLRNFANKIMVIDDLADRQHDCDLLLDQNFYRDMHTRYVGKVPNHCELLLGPTYALLREEFREIRSSVKPRTGEVKNVLVFFGGVDTDNYTTEAIKALMKLNWAGHVNVVVGQNHPNIKNIQDLCKSSRFECHIQTTKMASLMAQADLAIGAGGSSIWERFCMGLPSVCISTADNQCQQMADLQFEGLIFGAHKNADLSEALYEALLELKCGSYFYKNMSEKISHLVDGHGAIRVNRILIAPNIDMRLANKTDSINIFTWRNHPSIRHRSLSSNEIEWADHEKWFSQICGQINQPILIGEFEKKSIGVVRFDIRENLAEVSIYLVPESGNRGLGRKLLSEAEQWLRANRPNVLAICANVLPDNESSIKLFTTLRYVKHAGPTQNEFVKKL